jgi:hypothetical protein
MADETCPKCEADKASGVPYPRFNDKQATCFQCKKRVQRVLDLHHTNADLCSPECERDYWLDIAF